MLPFNHSYLAILAETPDFIPCGKSFAGVKETDVNKALVYYDRMNREKLLQTSLPQ